jgi:hypothetical protein
MTYTFNDVGVSPGEEQVPPFLVRMSRYYDPDVDPIRPGLVALIRNQIKIQFYSP